MIEYCQNEKNICKLPDCYETVKMKSLLLAYGTNTDFLCFWVQKNGEKTVSALMRFCDELTVWCDSKNINEDNISELRQFAEFLNLQIFAKTDLFEFFSKNVSASCVCMEFTGTGIFAESTELSYQQIYNLLADSDNKSIKLPEFRDWYVDFNHRVRHKTARYFSRNGHSVAVTGYETENFAIITGVTTDKKHRNSGLAKQNVLGLCYDLCQENRKVLLLCFDDMIPFYENLGFRVTDRLTSAAPVSLNTHSVNNRRLHNNEQVF